MPKLAVIQHPPVLLDRDASLAHAMKLVEAAADAGAQVIAFPEAYIGGYPTWIWRLRPGGDLDLTREIYERLFAAAIDLNADDLRALYGVARNRGVTVLMGLHERNTEGSRSTLFNTYVVIGPDGELKNRHRKLMPTNPERMIWGMGDASGLRVVDSPCGRLGTLICWENYMPLARFTLYAEGVELYVAPTWDYGTRWIGSMQHIAREGRCWVAGVCTSLRASEIPADFPGRDRLYPDEQEWVNPGDSLIVEPGGNIVAGPLHEEHGILFADIEVTRVAAARRTLDVAGHYSRPDIFQLSVNREPQPSLRSKKP